MKKVIAMTSLTLGALLIAGSAFAWNGNCGKRCDGPRDCGPGKMNIEQRHDRMDQHHEFMKVALDLSAEQQTQLDNLREKHQAERQAMRERMRASRNELRALEHNPDFDEAAFRAKAREKADLRVDMRTSRARHKQEMLAILTPQQQEKASKLWALHQEKRGDGDHHGGRGHHQGAGFCDRMGHDRY